MKKLIAMAVSMLLAVPFSFAGGEGHNQPPAIGIGIGVAESNSGGNSQSVNNPDRRTHVNFDGAAPMSTSQGKDEASMGLFGLIKSNPSADVVANNVADFVNKTKDSTDSLVVAQRARLANASLPYRFFGYGWEVTGNGLDTLFGLAKWQTLRRSERK